ncbi:MAG: S8 family serine peptidase [Actinobacteria bacterium]|nr:S8 family serine peptidase [Actinomycetota bacterium]
MVRLDRRPRLQMTSFDRLRLPLIALAASLALFALPAVAGAATVEPNQIVVQFEDPATGAAPSAANADPVVLQVDNVRKALAELRARDDVAYAVPNLIAHTSAASYTPNDPLLMSLQWNFIGPYGVRAQEAWANARAAGRSGGKGVTVAVLDTGVAYSNRVPFKRSPDFTGGQFVAGWDFVDGDPYANDLNGHGTHVAGTIAEATNNKIALAGLAYGAKIMPVRVLDRNGEGNANDIADGIRFAVKKRAKLINLSLEFDSGVHASDIPQLLAAINYARSRGVLVIGASGNEGDTTVSYPANAPGVMSVGATTENGCVADFSNGGYGLDIVAPGGGFDSTVTGESRCGTRGTRMRNIAQETFTGRSTSVFGIPTDYEGTSMATPHVTAAAALVIATRVIGSNPSAGRLESRLMSTSRDLGRSGIDSYYGAGLVDAAAASAK